ncbi:MAG: carbon-nitrogen hydrolase family protein, partial [Candidatus Bathyarchaeota archaeon]
MKIALIQQHATRDREDNIARGLKALEEAVSHGAQLIAFPELAFDFFLPQYPVSSRALNLAEPIPGPTTEIFSRKAKQFNVV